MVNAPSIHNVRRLDMNALPIILEMQRNGLYVDLGALDDLHHYLAYEKERLTEEVKQVTGNYINVGSGDQVADLLFRKLKLKQPVARMTPSGDRESVEAEILEMMKHAHPVVPLIQGYREAEKLDGTYVLPMPRLVGPDGRVRPNINVTRAETGRLSTRDPNLMAIPVRSVLGKEVRRAFIPAPGWCYITVDLSQIEMREAADRANCRNMIDIFNRNGDLHNETASKMFHLPIDKLDKDLHRYPAKRAGFGVLYLITAAGLLMQMPVGQGWTEAKCQDLIEAWYGVNPEIRIQALADQTFTRRFGFSHDRFGRIRRIPAIRSAVRGIRSEAERQAANMPVQSGAQGIIKLVMAEVHDIFSSYYDEIRPLLQIHDELLFEVKRDLADEVIGVIGEVIERCCPLKVPLKWNGAKGDSWAGLEK